jgi:hypothetical protein
MNRSGTDSWLDLPPSQKYFQYDYGFIYKNTLLVCQCFRPQLIPFVTIKVYVVTNSTYRDNLITVE